jgi:hypothetical protein
VDGFISCYKQILETGRDLHIDSELDVGGETRYIRTTINYVGISKECGLPTFVNWNEDITGIHMHYIL